jgi:DNA sulfur modification protein DndC
MSTVFGQAAVGAKQRTSPVTSGNLSLWDDQRLTLADSIELALRSLLAYLGLYQRIAVAFSGGKDSTTVLTLLLHFIATGQVPLRYDQVTILYADTRMELPMLHQAALGLLDVARRLGCAVEVVQPPLDDRFFVRMLGRGYPPPNNGFRWCVGLLKIEPMQAALRAVHTQAGGKFLTLTGMRIGESAARDQRIALACSKHDGECSQGWFQQTTPASVADVLAPILHFRVCHVGDWLMFQAPDLGYPTLPVIEAYGAGIGDTEKLSARTGCIRCPVAGHDTTLDRVIKTPRWAYLSPFTRLWDVYEELSSSRCRLRKQGERLKSGKMGKRPMRQGPLTMKARRWGIAQVLDIQAEVNAAARLLDRPEVVILAPEEVARIEELIAANTWPELWEGTEVRGDVLVDQVLADGIVQPILFALESDL